MSNNLLNNQKKKEKFISQKLKIKLNKLITTIAAFRKI